MFWVFVLGFAFFFLWRELDLDQEFFADRMFSWAYLFRDSVPLSTKLILGLPSIGLSSGLGGVCGVAGAAAGGRAAALRPGGEPGVGRADPGVFRAGPDLG